MTKEELEKEARKYLAEHSEYSKVFGQTFIKVDTLTAMVAFAEPREERIAELEAQIEKMKKYIKACWVEENLNDYSSYITNSSDEFRDLVKELNEEIRNGR